MANIIIIRQRQPSLRRSCAKYNNKRDANPCH
jgi:hypothetical protein